VADGELVGPGGADEAEDAVAPGDLDDEVSGNRGSRLRQVVGRLQLTESGSKSRLWLTESVHVDGRLTVLLLCLLPFSPVIAL